MGGRPAVVSVVLRGPATTGLTLRGLSCGAALTVLGLGACASVERGRYGVDSLRFEGAEQLDTEALGACLITRERESFDVRIGLSEPVCGRPPFDSSPPTLRLWRWPWTEWPTYNQAVFDQDQERILRWYRARGFYDARVVEVRLDPPQAAEPGASTCVDCTVSLLVVIDEGEPTRVATIELQGFEGLDPKLRERAASGLRLKIGAPVDESLYDEDRDRIAQQLRAASYAAAAVEGRVEVDSSSKSAQVVYRAVPGPAYHFGELNVSGHGDLPEHVIRAAAALPAGAPFDPAIIDEVHAEVFALGAFSSVEVQEILHEAEPRVDLNVVVTPLPRDALRLGIGVTSGALRRTETADVVGVPQWDIHLFGSYERRHVLGSLGRFTLDERPRLIFSREFPRFTTPELGNIVTAGLNQPGLLEARTETFQRVGWDYGPDPFLGFRRSELFFRVGARRGFFRRRLLVTLSAEQDRFIVDSNSSTSDGSPLPSSYDYTFFEQDFRLDLRDDRARSTQGIFVALTTAQAPRWSLSDWTAFRVAPELRTYLRLPLELVWANRFALAALFIQSASSHLDPLSQELGPNPYRLRGGGAYSNRGFLAGTLGVGLTGGIRRWETSTELRVPLGTNFVVAGFLDLGDVSDQTSFRFSYLNTTAGYGLRYYTPLGALRLDVGYRLLRWQRTDGSPGWSPEDSTLPFSDRPGAVHLTIGDPF